MARVGGSYESVVRGVSEQAPQDRRSGQMWEQVNMISDPVHGLTRRQGSQYINSVKLRDIAGISETQVMSDSELMKVREFNCNGLDYDIIYSKNSRQVLPAILAFDKVNNRFLTVTGSGGIWNAIQANGVASMTNIGRFLFIAAKGYWPTYSTTQIIEGENDRKRMVIWIRNGDYSREYTFQYTRTDGRQYNATYRTPSSAYPGALNTSQVPVPTIDMSGNPSADEISRRLAVFNQQMSVYNKQVADITNAYNTAVTQWVSTSSQQIQPNYIAQQLQRVILEQCGGIPNIAVDNQYVIIDTPMEIRSGQVVDGGDGTYMRSVSYSADNPENLTPICWYNKVVKIKPKSANGKDTYYVRAEPKNSSDGRSWGEVTWREYCGVQTMPTTAFAIGTVKGNTLFIGSTPNELDSMLGQSDTPKFQGSAVGDQVSAPIPAFLKGREINYLGSFQDRLLVGTGSTLFCSKPGDYLNWFRGSVLTVNDNDPVEMYALGSEDDTIYWDTSFDRNHVLFGRKNQYLIPGRSLLTPKNPSIQVMSKIEDAIEAAPQQSSNFVFYAKDTATKGSLHQIQVGATSDSAESYECSQQLDKYMAGKPCEILCMTAPFNILVRTRGKYNGFYVYTYLDSMQGGERLFDSWSRWEWDEKLGSCCGLNKYKGDLLCYTARYTASGLWMVCDKFTFDTDLPNVPLLDSWRSYNTAAQFPLWWTSAFEPVASIAYRNTHPYFLLGSSFSKRYQNMPGWEADAAHMVLGINFTSYCIPTSPFLRDRNDKAIINGRLTLGSMTVSVSNTGGIMGELVLPDRDFTMKAFDGRILTRQSNLAGRAPLVNTTVRIPVYKEIREFKLMLTAVNWLPLTITGMEWLGQWFSTIKRV